MKDLRGSRKHRLTQGEMSGGKVLDYGENLTLAHHRPLRVGGTHNQLQKQGGGSQVIKETSLDEIAVEEGGKREKGARAEKRYRRCRVW